MKKQFTFTFPLGTALCLMLTLGGCGQSKEEKAVERMHSRKTPAHLRVINFGTQTFAFYNKGIRFSTGLKPLDSTGFIIASPGNQDVSFKVDDKSIYEQKFSLQTDEAQTLLVTPKTTKLVTGDLMDSEKGQSSVRVYYVGGTKPLSVASGADKVATGLAPDSESTPFTLAPGDHGFKITTEDGKSAEVSQSLGDRDCYTIVVMEAQGKLQAEVFKNSLARKPISQAPSASG